VKHRALLVTLQRVLLSQVQKNAIFLTVKQTGFDPVEFKLGVFNNDETILTHKPSNSEFSIGSPDLGGGIIVKMVVGDGPRLMSVANDWGPLLRTWLEQLKVELGEPDLWAENGKQPLSELMQGDDNTLFSPAEQDRIADVLAEIKREAAEAYGLPDVELHALNAKIDYLIEARKHTRRKDWLIVAVTIISQPIVSDILTPAVMHKVLATLDAGLAGMFGHPPMLNQ
jgi:hypothetical protein